MNANAMFQKNDLKSIYKKVKDEINELADDENSVKTQAGREGRIGNAISLRLSTEASIQLLKEAMPQGYNLFYILGCLPDGILEEHLP